MDRGDDFVLVEALSPRLYASVHLPGAVNLPLESIEVAKGVLPDEGAEIVVYCMDPDCATSGETVRELAEMGYENVRRYAGGKQDWIDAGLPVEGTHAADVRRRLV
jgi:rhodanese-related sulfurtransferase